MWTTGVRSIANPVVNVNVWSFLRFLKTWAKIDKRVKQEALC